MKTLFTLFFALIGYLLPAQTLKVEGVVRDSLTEQPLPNVHIYLSAEVGTISNLEGAFQLKWNDLDLSDSKLRFSCVGYNDLELQLDSTIIETSLIIYLAPGINILDEVIVTAKSKVDSAYIIMQKVLNNIRKNYPVKKYSLEAFYREANISDTSYSRIIEAQLFIADKGYDIPIEKVEMEVLQMRKTEDNRDLGWRQSLFEWLYSINGAYKTLGNDRVRLSTHHLNHTEIFENSPAWITYQNEGSIGSIRFLSKEFISSSDLDMQEVLKTTYDTTYVIQYAAQNPIMNRRGQGLIYISKADWAVIEIRSEVVKADTTKSYMFDYTLGGSHTYYTTVIKYQKINSKYYLSYVKASSIGTNARGLFGLRDPSLFSESKGKKGTIYQYNELYITGVLSYKKISRRKRLDKEEDPYDIDIENDVNFWASYNYPLLNPLSEKMKNDLKNDNDEIFIK